MATQTPVRDMTTDMELRLRCMQLAGHLSTAQYLYAWVVGETDKTPKEAILDALEAAGVR